MFEGKKDCSWPPLNKYAINVWLSSLRIRAHLSWRTGKPLHVLHVLRTYSTCSYPGYQDTTTYAALHLASSCRDLIFINSRNGIEWKWTSFLDFFSGIKVSATRLDEYALKNNPLGLYRRVSYFPPSSSFWSTILLQYLCNQMFRPLETCWKSVIKYWKIEK